MISVFATPGENYLARIGEMAYAVSSLEWTLLGDLGHLPVALTVDELAGKTTGGIAKSLIAESKNVIDTSTATYLEQGGQALAEIAQMRNDVLHARPATIGGRQMLYRWHKNGSVAFPITDEWFNEKLHRIGELTRNVHNVRPALPT